jgi:hypothetical protein
MAQTLPWSPHWELGISHWQLEVKYTRRNGIEEPSSARTIKRVQLIAIACPRLRVVPPAADWQLWGQTRHIHDVRAMSACAPTADVPLQRGR